MADYSGSSLVPSESIKASTASASETLALEACNEVLKASLEALRESFQGPDSFIKAPELTMEVESTSMEVAESPMFSTRLSTRTRMRSQTIEILKLKNELTHLSTLKKISDQRCIAYKREVQELKEQLDMFRSASQLGVFEIKSLVDAPSEEDMAGHRQEVTESQSQEYIIASLKSQLEKCVNSNTMKSAEIMAGVHQITALTSELTGRQQLLDKFTAVATELENTRLRAENEKIGSMTRKMHSLMQENDHIKESLANALKDKMELHRVNGSLNMLSYSLYEKYELEKRAAIEISQKAIRERLRDTELRLKHTEQHLKDTIDRERQHPKNPEGLDYMVLCARMYVDNSIREALMKEKIVALVENILRKIINLQQGQMDIANNEYQNLLSGQGAVQESETLRMCRLMIVDKKLACLSEQKDYVQSLLGCVQFEVSKLLQHQRPSANIDPLQCAEESQMSKSSPPNDMNDLI